MKSIRREVRWRGSKANGLSASETEAIQKEWDPAVERDLGVDFKGLPADSEGAMGADGVGFGVKLNKFDRLMFEKWRERERLLDPVVQGIYDEKNENEVE